MKNVKIVFIDLDGTLKDDNEKINNKYKIIFKKLTSLGIKIILCTGRGKKYTESICKQFEIGPYIITSNGAYIYNCLNKNEVFKSPISKNNLTFLNTLINKYNLYFMVNTSTSMYTNKDFDLIGKKSVKSLEEVDVDVFQVIVQSKSYEELEKMKKDLEEHSDIYVANESKNKEREGLLFLDIVNKNISKGFALKFLCEHLKIDASKSMAIGDSDNDIEMLKTAGVKIVMENGSLDAKRVADIVTLSNNQDGVYVILERLYKELISG